MEEQTLKLILCPPTPTGPSELFDGAAEFPEFYQEEGCVPAS